MKWTNESWMIANKTNKPPRTKPNKKGKTEVRPNHGKLHYPYPEPSFLADPAHRKKTLKKYLHAKEAKNQQESGGP